MKERPIIFSAPMVCAILTDDKTQTRRVIKDERILIRTSVIAPQEPLYRGDEIVHLCPYGRVGDRLWLREAWRWSYHTEGAAPRVVYRATAPTDDPDDRGAWKSPLFLSRSDSRLTLLITDIRVERLQHISELDCEAELGVPAYSLGNDACPRFQETWEALNGKRGYGWEANPWVWALTFHRVPQENRVAA